MFELSRCPFQFLVHSLYSLFSLVLFVRLLALLTWMFNSQFFVRPTSRLTALVLVM